MDHDHTNQAERQAQFMRLYVVHQAAIRAFIWPLVRRQEDVEEVMQNASLAAWNKFSELVDHQGFGGWFCVIAKFEVLNYRRKHARDRLVFDEDLLQQLADELLELDPLEEQRQLQRCLELMTPTRRQLILKAYTHGKTTAALATELGKSQDALYQILSRTRKELAVCIHGALKEGRKNAS